MKETDNKEIHYYWVVLSAKKKNEAGKGGRVVKRMVREGLCVGDLWVTWGNLTEGGSDRGTVGAEALREYA